MKKSVAQNYLYSLSFQILQLITPLVLTPYLSRTLGAEGIGTYGYVQSIVVIFMLFGTMGINMYAQREIAYVQDDIEKRSNIFFEIIILRGISVIGIYLIYLFAFMRSGESVTIYRIASIEIIASIFEISFFFQGINSFKVTVFRNIIIKIISVILIFAFVKTKEDVDIYILILCGMMLIGNLSIWCYLPQEIILPKLSKLRPFRHVKTTLALFLPQIAMQIYTVLDKTMLGILSDKTQVGYYESVQKIVVVSMTVITSLGSVMLTKVANTLAMNEEEEAKYSIVKAFQFVFFLATPMVFGMIAIAPQLIPWFLGKDFVDCAILLEMMAPLILISGLSNVLGIQYLVPSKKHKLYTYAVFSGAIINILLNFMLIPYLQAVGATVATIVAEGVVLGVEIYFVRKEFSFWNILKSNCKFLLASIVMFIILKTAFFNLNFFVKIIVGGIIYCLICLAFFIRNQWWK